MNAITEVQVEPSTALTVIPASAISTIIAADADDILGAYAAKVRAFKADVSTERGRGEMKSLAAEGRKVKAALLRLAAGLKETALKTQRAINAEERILEERMNALIANIRAPLTAFEDAEKQRVKDHEDALARMQESPEFFAANSAAEDLRARLDYLGNQPPRDWQEFAQRASDVLADEIAKTEAALARAVFREKEAAELARLRAEAEERARHETARLQAEREARIAKEAAEKARRDAESKAEQERQETLRAAADERARVEREAKAERDRAAAAAAEAERVRQETVRRAERAERDREEAERRRLADAEAAEQARQRAAEEHARRVEAEKKAAVEADRKRHAAEAEALRGSDERRAANIAHRRKVNQTIVAALVLCGLAEKQSQAVIAAVVRGHVPSMRIDY